MPRECTFANISPTCAIFASSASPSSIAPDVMLQTVPILDAILETQEQKDALWTKVKGEQQSQADDAALIAALESEAKTALLAKEK